MKKTETKLKYLQDNGINEDEICIEDLREYQHRLINDFETNH